MTEVLVGCCGFPIGMKKYFELFVVVEVQKTFYNPPSPETLRNWRVSAPSGFEFTVKAWQLITHPPSSPTYRKAGLKLNASSQVGFFKPTREVFDAWERTREACTILGARVCVFQTPRSFKETPENIKNMKEFFSSISDGVEFAWEPRGWSPETVKLLCEELKILHVVDPFNTLPATQSETVYFRLHGSPPGKKLYRYKYTESDLAWLAGEVKRLSGRVYVMFNNVYMKEDALKFKSIIFQQPPP